MISEKLRFWALTYFARNACPKSFSLSSEKAKSNNFYEVKVIFSTEQGEILYRFIPDKGRKTPKGLIKGSKYFLNGEIESCFFSETSLKDSKIDVIYYLGVWSYKQKNCSNFQLLKMVLWKSLALMRVDIIHTKITNRFHLWRINKRLRTPLKSKFEIYECLMLSDSFLCTGTFRKSEIIKIFLGGKSIRDFNFNRKFSQSLEWILDASVEDGEIVRVGHKNDSDPLFKMKGKGIHYFTLTKEQIKNEEHHKQIQKSQVRIQSRMLLLTVLLVVATFMTAIDKFDATLVVMNICWEWIVSTFHSIKAT